MGVDFSVGICIIILVTIIIILMEEHNMNQKNTSFGLTNMNGISDDSGRICALSDMNCRKGQPEQSPSLQDMNAANAQPDRTCSLTNMNCRRD